MGERGRGMMRRRRGGTWQSGRETTHKYRWKGWRLELGLDWISWNGIVQHGIYRLRKSLLSAPYV